MKQMAWFGLVGMVLLACSSAYTAQVPKLAAGGLNSMGLRYDGTAWSWGDNDHGQLGNGTNGLSTSTHIPQHVLDISRLASIAVGDGHALAVANNGVLWTWGYNSFGQLGNGTNGAATSTNLPWQNPYVGNIAAIAAGRFHSMVLTTGGAVWTFGYNYYGQLGNGSSGITAFAKIPVQVTGVSDVMAIAGGGHHSLALQNNGQLWSWGYNLFGQLGNGSITSTNNPVTVPGLTNIKSMVAGLYHSLAVTLDNHLYAWGLNNVGQLGVGHSEPSQFANVPLPVMADVVTVAAGSSHSVALKTDGSVWTWGRNQDGELGIGLSIDHSDSPVQVTGVTNVVAIAAGSSHVLALQADGGLYAWGHNNRGQAGIDWNICINTNWPTMLTNWPQNINAPSTPIGTTNGYILAAHLYSSGGSTSLWGRTLEYQFDFGESTSSWSAAASASNTWSAAGTYALRARARSAADPSVTSDWSATLTVVMHLGAASGLVASDGNYADRLQLTWQSLPGAATYQIWRHTTNDSSAATQVGTTAETNYTGSVAPAGQILYYWVKGANGDNIGNFSDPDSGWRRSVACTHYADVDLDGDRKMDLVIFDPATGTWSARLSASGYAIASAVFGGPDCTLVPGDYDGDDKVDPAIYQEATGLWTVMLSSLGYATASATLGGMGFMPAPSDFDGDGKTDPAVYQLATGIWSVMLSASGYALAYASLGGDSYVPVQRDYDGDRKADPAVYQESTGLWSVLLSASGYALARAQFGETGYLPVPGDYDGDIKTDPGLYQQATGNWQVMLSASGYALASALGFGGPGYIAMPGDYDGDGKTDPAIYDTISGNWSVMLSSLGYGLATANFGGEGYDPVGIGPFQDQ